LKTRKEAQRPPHGKRVPVAQTNKYFQIDKYLKSNKVYENSLFIKL
jgi:hypothetical protein